MNYTEAVAWLSGLRRFGIKLGLERFRELLRLAGNPHECFASAHIAGTNGKGSVTSMIAEGAQAAGMKTGRYLSPYVFDLRERIQINGEMISRDSFCRLATQARSIVESVERTPLGQATEFEAKTLIGFLHFAGENVDLASVEVGLGGRLDATNLIAPLVSVITNISYDHMDRLGDTLAQIAFEKAGIIKPGVPVVSGVLDMEARVVIEETAAERSAPLTPVEPYCARASIFRPSGTVYYYTPGHSTPEADGFTLVKGAWELPRLRPRLQGEFQAANAGCAAAALLQLREAGMPVSDDAIRAGIERAWLPGRLQVLSEDPFVLADAAHNPAGADALARFLAGRLQGRKLTLVVAMTKPHKPAEFIHRIEPLAERIILTTVSVPNAWTLEELAREIGDPSRPFILEPDPVSAIEKAVESTRPGEAVCITGSFYLVGAIPENLRGSLGIMAKNRAADGCPSR